MRTAFIVAINLSSVGSAGFAYRALDVRRLRRVAIIYAEFPIWTSGSRIVRFSCPEHYEFATRADPSEISGFDGSFLPV
jgi:hypothetical protein